jgi:hypothetical protein
MPETQPTATAAVVAIPAQPERAWTSAVVRGVTAATVRTGVWAGDTAQKFGALVSALMAPAVFSAYALAAWSLAGNLGWTDSFMFTSGPLSNWMVWAGLAVLMSVASSILRRHTQPEL